MSADPPPDHSTIGVCFSGGGFRASFYALGVLRYLAEARLLDRLVAISAVSGGSIAAAAAGDGWRRFQDAGGTLDAFLAHIDAPFRATVTSKNIRRRWIASSLVPFRGGRGAAYARALAGNLYAADRIADLPAHPEFIFTATDLTKGRAFRLSSGFVGSYDHGYAEPAPATVPLGHAVAASAAFPPSFTVLQLATGVTPGTLSLVDGGVYDNLGLEWFQGWEEDAVRPASATRPAFTIVANASGILAERNKRFHPIGAFRRDLAIQYEQSLSLRVRWYRRQLAAAPGTGVYLAVKSDPRAEPRQDPTVLECALPTDLVRPLALLRTDLDRFAREEADLLSYHAYWTLHARLGTYAPDLALAAPGWRDYAGLSAADTERLRRILELGAHRFFRGIRRRLGGG